MGFLNILVTDIISDNISFTPTTDGESGRNKVLKANKFWNANNGLEIIEESLMDAFTVGQIYNWVGRLSPSNLRKEISSTIDSKLEFKEIENKIDKVISEINKNGSSSLVKKFRYIPASTVSIKNDEHEVTKYIQRVGVNTKIFEPEEVIHIKLIPFDGKVYGYPPLECLLSEIYLLWLITQNYVSFFENGGHPDKIFVLPKEIAGSKNHKYLIETLKKYKKVQNKHGNLVFTGDISVEDLQKFESKMEYKELGLYLVGILAMFYGIPVGRIPFLIGKASNQGDSGGLADAGYWRKVSVWQSKIEIAYNNKLFNPYFGVDIKFSRGYKQDEVRETQNEMQKTSVAEQRLRMGLWTPELAGKYLGIDPEDVKEAQEDKKKRDEEEFKSSMQGQNMNNNGSVIPEPDKQTKNKTKSITEKNNQNSTAKA